MAMDVRWIELIHELSFGFHCTWGEIAQWTSAAERVSLSPEGRNRAVVEVPPDPGVETSEAPAWSAFAEP